MPNKTRAARASIEKKRQVQARRPKVPTRKTLATRHEVQRRAKINRDARGDRAVQLSRVQSRPPRSRQSAEMRNKALDARVRTSNKVASAKAARKMGTNSTKRITSRVVGVGRGAGAISSPAGGIRILRRQRFN